MFNLIVIILPFIFPYYLLGENVSNLILLIIGIIFLFFRSRESLIVNKLFLCLIMLFIVVAFISTCLVNPTLYSFSGFSVYLNLVVYYISYCYIFSVQGQRKLYLKFLLIGMTVTASYYLLSEGMLYEIRIRGNFGYSNTYALFLLFSVVLNQVLNLKYNRIISVILITTLFATGSRLTLVLLVAYVVCLMFKKKKYLSLIMSILISLVGYSLISQLGIRSLFFFPVLFWIMKKLKDWHYWLVGGVGVLCFIGTNTYERLLNISIKNGSFLERLISFEDAIEAIKQQPFGHGIQSYEFSHFIYDTAFYDPKYLHNSVLQIMYDIGIIGGISFLILMFYAYYNSRKESFYLKFALISLFVHSLMDFDIAFSATFIVISLLVSLSGKDMIRPVNRLASVFLIPSLYLLLYELLLGTVVSTQLPISDYRANLLLATNFLEYSDWEQALEQLKLAEEKETLHPNVIWNLAYVHEKIGTLEEAMAYRLKSVQFQRYHQDAYRQYHRLLEEQYVRRQDQTYVNKQQELLALYEQAISNQNSKAIYLPNQLDDIQGENLLK